jgi:hypothetical protein
MDGIRALLGVETQALPCKYLYEVKIKLSIANEEDKIEIVKFTIDRISQHPSHVNCTNHQNLNRNGDLSPAPNQFKLDNKLLKFKPNRL